MNRAGWLVAAVLAATLGWGPQARAEDWSGFYAAVLHEAPTPIYDFEGGFVNIGKSGVAIATGYNFDQGEFVFGIDKIIAYTPIASIDCEMADPFYDCDGVFDAHKFAFQVMGRVGYEITDTSLLYGAAGLGRLTVSANGKIESFGYGAVAAGLEIAMTEQFFARLHAQGSFPADTSEVWMLTLAAGVGFRM